ncbi:hypothetical protein CEK71_17005 [Methylovulum psychrotolerans]|uniref:Roadblock/LAMTOR2 domain-containing protein n=1 Tax=Methylovulum psychrotolerans TaxID=1704499 RepID=A0A1Z4C287_9GAMM|nr:hypothetical protein CEK71_17005 [Methylovulum psychrotolerans]
MENSVDTLPPTLDDGIKCSAITSTDGLVLAHTVSGATLDEDFLGAMGAALFAFGSKSIANLVGGKMKDIVVEGEQGFVKVTILNDKLLMVTVAEPLKLEN